MDEQSQFEAFVRERGDALLRFARALTGDSATAEDLVQAALLRALLRWNKVQQADRPYAYVKGIIMNEYLGWWRRLSRRLERSCAAIPDKPVPDFNNRVVDRAEVWQLLATLAPRQRAVLVLRYYEGMSDSEIASAIGCAPSTVRSQAARALATIRRLLGEQLEFEGKGRWAHLNKSPTN